MLIITHLHLSYKIPLFASLEIIVFFPPLTAIETVFHDSPSYALCDEESLFCHQREPLFYKRGKSDIFLRKKFVMSLFRIIFAFENGREMANLGFVFTECLHSGFALPSLWVRSASTLASLPEAKKSTRQCGSRDKVQMLWHLRDRVGLRSPLRYRDNSLGCRFTSRSNKLSNSKRLTN